MSTYRRLLAYLTPYRAHFGAALLSMLVYSGATAGAALIIKFVLDDIFIGRDVEMLKIVPLAVVVVYLLKGLAFFVQTYLMKFIGQSIIRDLRNDLYDQLLRQSLSFYTARSTGSLMSRVLNDVILVQFAVTNSLAAVIRDPLTIIGLVGVIFYRSWTLATIALVAFPLAAYPLLRLGRSFRKNARRSQEKISRLTTLLHETISGIKIVKAFGMEDFERERFQQENQRLFRLYMKAKRIESISPPIMESLGTIGLAAVVFIGGREVIENRLTTGEFFSFITALLLLYEPFKRLTTVNNATQEALAAAERIFEVLETPVDVREQPGALELGAGRGAVAFRQVSFTYGQENVLSEIDLEVAPGEVLAIVGSSGGGKSTLVSLLPRFYDVTGGSITLDGTDIRTVTLKSLRERISIVTQETILFNDTVGMNIAYGRAGASQAQIEEAACAAYAHDFIVHLPQGYATIIGERGVTLSGGERQRLCIARAILKDAPVLILDEATSALDAESEALVQKALDNLMSNRTTLVIAHRLGTVVNAQRIAVLDHGRIVQVGRHAQLLETSPVYRKLHQLHLRKREKPRPGA